MHSTFAIGNLSSNRKRVKKITENVIKFLVVILSDRVNTRIILDYWLSPNRGIYGIYANRFKRNLNKSRISD